MDAKTFEKEKDKILKSSTKYRCLNQLKTKLEEKAKLSDVINYGETPFEYNDQDVACQEFGWPDEVAWNDLAIKVIEEYIKKQNWEWEITRVVSDASPKYYHGILRNKAGGAKTSGGGNIKKSGSTSAAKQTEDAPKKSKSKIGALFGGNKRKEAGGGSGGGGKASEGGGEDEDEKEEDPDDFYFSLQ